MHRSIYTLLLITSLAACAEEQSSPPAVVSEAPESASTFEPQAVFDARCAHCHDGSVPKAPHQIGFQLVGARAIEQTLTTGLMATHASGLSPDQIRQFAAFLGGEVVASEPVKMCEQKTIPAVAPPTQGWSLQETGTRYIPDRVAQLPVTKVADLKLKWVFAYPGATRARSQPVPFGDALLVGSQDGTVYALSLHDGCAHWTYRADIEVRSALAVNPQGTKAYFGDIKGTVYAIDPRDGTQLWRAKADAHPDTTLTGSPRLFEDTLYVPLSSTEWGSAADPGYACCTFRGGVVAFDAATGAKRWTSYAIPTPPAPTGRKNELGVELFHPAGAPIWNSPTIDAKRRLLYVGTGEAYTSPAADTSDSVLAIDLDTGKLMWHYQSISGDAWNMACFIGGGANCPEEDGPDLDIGAPPVLVNIEGRDLVIAGQKSGDVFALNPTDGTEIWRKKVGRGGFAGGIHWGLAVADGVVFATNADTVFTGRFTGPRKPGLFALNALDGEILWFAPAPDVCPEADKPACDQGYSAAATAIDGVVFAGAFDGHLRAYDASSGELLWDFNTHGEFPSVSGEIAKGGSIESDGPVVYRGHVLVNSGYLFGDRMPGNALLVFAVPG
jgi:polyvinyl alcohol dehydrogenase (cytochrome)